MYYLTDELTVINDETGNTSGITLGQDKTQATERLVSISVSLLEQRQRVFNILKQVDIPKPILLQLKGQVADMTSKLEKIASGIEGL